MEIDCSKAPEGATHWGPETDCHCESWYEVKDGAIVRFLPADEAAKPMRYAEHGPAYYHSVSDLVALPAAWTGACLPPVGAKVILSDANHDVFEPYKEMIGVEVTVVASFASPAGFDMIACALPDGLCGCFRADMARPIRTPEQIASEEALEEIERLYSEGGPAAVFDAGYRKQA